MMTLRSFFRLNTLVDYLGKNTLLLAAVLFVIGALVILWTPLNAAEPETSDPSEITRDAVASLEAAKVELLPKQGELEAEEMRIQREIEGTIGDCRQIRAEYIMASGGKIGAEGAVTALEEVSRNNPSVAERISDQLEEARLLVTVHETKMGEAIARAEELEASQNSLLTRREEVKRQIREIKSAVAILDAAIRELKPPSRLTASSIDWTVYSREPVVSRRGEETIDVPQIAACMSLVDPNPNSTLSRVQSLGERDTYGPGKSVRGAWNPEEVFEPGHAPGDL